jgi:murein DD-endopeptidase MepM/ murein hydrolase activator NlpD
VGIPAGLIVRRIGTVAAIVWVLLLGTVLPASADLQDDLREAAAGARELEALVGGVRAERTDLANQILDTGAALEVLIADLESAQTLLDESNRQIALTESRMLEISDGMARRVERIDGIRSDITGIKSAAVERAVELYMQGESGSTLAIFRAEDLGKVSIGLVYASRAQAAADRTIGALENLGAQENLEMQRLGTEQLALEEEAEFLEFERDERVAFAELVEIRSAEAASQLAIQQGQLAELGAEIAFIEGEIDVLEREQAQIKQLILQQSGQGGSRPGALWRPVPGAVSSPYGYRIHPVYGDRRLHTGWDMNAACGAPIYAAASGTVIYSGWKGGYGYANIIDHGGGMSTLYGHLSTLGAGYGTEVNAGDVIGPIGTTGVSTGCHLHFEVRINGSPVDPAPYM